MEATARRLLDLDGVEATSLADYDYVRFRYGNWKRIDVRETDDGIEVNSDIGGPISIEMVSANQFIIKWPVRR